MKLVYIVNFSINGNSGKNKATREKAAALESIVGKNNFTFIHASSSRSRLNKIVKRFFFDFELFFKFLSFKGDFVVVQRVIFLPLTSLIFWLRGVKVITEFHADFREEIPFLNKSWLEQGILYFISYFYNFNYRISDGIIFNHPYLKEKFDSIFKKPSIYSYNGSNYKEFNPAGLDNSREKLGIPKNRRIYLFLGSVSQWHGVDLLIETFNKDIINKRNDIYLYIVGVKDNLYTRQLRKESLNKNVLFIDAVDTLTASCYINAADICLLPVKQIRTSPGSPLKLYDYISCGKAVVTQANLAGYSDEVLNYNLGFVTDFNNSDLAANDLIQIMEKVDIEYYRENNRNVAVTEVSWNNRMNVWVEFIKLVCNGH